jgi:aminoglycoside phosphotransferase (APT) family kinase protein
LAHITQSDLQRIFNAHGLGKIHDFAMPARGSVNLVVIINDQYVVRMDTRPPNGTSRFLGEKIAYDFLAGSGLPVPRVIALDLSKKLIYYDYIIMTKLPGTPVIDAWDTLTPQQRHDVSFQAGEFLAHMHNVTINHFGALKEIGNLRQKSVYEDVSFFFKRAATEAHHIGQLSAHNYQEVEALLNAAKPLLEKIRHGHIVHSDYQLENLLQEDGVITGIIDFEWVLGGDPTWDFVAEEKWDAQCPGSRKIIYDGYTSVRRLDSDHELRVRLYKALMHIETIAGSNDWREWAKGELDKLLHVKDSV